jgi:15-cis-phytoene synthase
VLITIYHGLLRRIERRNYDVFSERVRVPIATRIGILLCGLAQMAFNRLLGRK